MYDYKSVPMDIRQAHSLELILGVKLPSPVILSPYKEKGLFIVEAFDLLKPELSSAIEAEYQVLCEEKQVQDERHLLPDCCEAETHFYPVTKCVCGNHVCFNCAKEFVFKKEKGFVFLYSCPFCGRNIEIKL